MTENLTVSFDEWAPDRAALATGMLRTLNLIPTPEGYESGPGFVDTTTYPDLPETPLRVVAFDISDGDISTIAFCQFNIYELRAGVWAKITHQVAGEFVPYTTDNDGFWSFVKWGDMFYAVNYNDNIQRYVFASGGFCTDITGLPGGLRARFNVIIRDFHVMFDTNDASGSNATPFRMHWSGRLRPEDFNPSLATGAGFRDIIDIGNLVNAVGGEFGYINGTDAGSRIDTIGPPLQFAVARVDEDIGCLFRETMVKVSGSIFWYSQKGWRRSEGGPSRPIGQSRVDRYFRQRIDQTAVNLISSVVLRDKPIIFYSYVSTDSVDRIPDEAIFYNYDVDRWSEGAYKIRSLGTAGPIPLFSDDPTFGEMLVDDLDQLVDAENDIKSIIVAVSPDNKLQMIVPSADSAFIETREVQLIKAKRAQVTRVRLIAEGDSDQYQARISSRDKQPSMDVTRDPWLNPEKSGSCGANKSGRYHRAGFRLFGAFTSVLGAELFFEERGDK